MTLINFKEIPYDTDQWELFARDFFEGMGFYIESPPNRGPDGGKDFIATEDVNGILHRYKFRWLVSCKHYAKSNKSVNENDDEKNILERVSGFNADGFIGFYSTLASSGLVNRLDQLRGNLSIKDFKIIDSSIIEQNLLTIGYSNIFKTYLPESYKSVKPIHKLFSKYIPLECDYCGKDLLENIALRGHDALYAYVDEYKDNIHHHHDMYFACKGECDKNLQAKMYKRYGTVTGWSDLKDLTIPLNYLRFIYSSMNLLADPTEEYEKIVLDKEKNLLAAMGQIVFREMTKEETERVIELINLPIC